MSILGQVREPIIPPPPPTVGSNPTVPTVGNAPGGFSSVVANSQDQFDSYLSKLQNICTESNGGNGIGPASNPIDPAKSHYCATPSATPLAPPKTALQPYNSAAKL